MTSPKEFLLKLHKNLQRLELREAKYGGLAAPVSLIMQIEDFREAIRLTEQGGANNISLENLQSRFSDLNLEIRDTVEFLPARKPFDGRNPYRGLEKFTEQDSEYFFGRSTATEKLVALTQALIEIETSDRKPALLAVIGASGSGKSSLVQAGLIPALRQGCLAKSESWPIQVIRPGPNPIESLAAAFVELTGRGLRAMLDDLQRDDQGLHYLINEVLAGQADDSYLPLVIDQFEELFTLCEQETERQAFIKLLLYEATHPHHRGLLILTMRTDFYGHASQYPYLAQALTAHQLLVAPMTPRELREAILLPTEAVGLEMERDLAMVLVQDTLDAPGALPLLQHALLELYNRRSEDNVLTMAAYQEIGGVRGALAHRADAVLKLLTDDQRELARNIFLRLTTLGEGISDTRRRVNRQELYPAGADAEAIDTVLQALSGQAARLIVADNEQVEVTHEALIQQWGQLRKWLEANRDSLRLHRRVTEGAAEWQANQRDDSYLFRGARLAEAEAWITDHGGDLTSTEWAFLSTSLAERDRLATDAEERRQQELAQQRLLAEEQRQRAEDQTKAAARLRRRAWIASGIGLIAMIAAIVAVIFFLNARRNEQRAEAERVQAESKALAFAAIAQLTQDPELALLLARQAMTVADTVEAQEAMHQALQATRVEAAFNTGDEIVEAVFDQSGQRLAAFTRDDVLKVWQAPYGSDPITTIASNERIVSLAFNPDGQQLATSTEEGLVTIWNVTTGEQVKSLSGLTKWVMALAFSPDGTLLAVSDQAGQVTVWNFTEEVIKATLQQPELMHSLAFDQAGSRLITGSQSGWVKLWSLNPPTELIAIKAHEGIVRDLISNEDETRLITVGTDEQGYIWDLTSQVKIATLSNHTNTISDLALDKSGNRVATSSYDGTIQIWQADSGQHQLTLLRHAEWIHAAAFGPKSNQLTSVSQEGIIKVWNIGPTYEGVTLAGHTGSIDRLAFNSKGDRLATAGFDHTARIWDPVSGQGLLTITNHLDRVTQAIFSSDGRYLATASQDGHIGIWDATTGQAHLSMLDYGDEVWSIAFHPDERTLASGGDGGRVKIWNTDNGKVLKLLETQTQSIHDLVFDQEGSRLATSSDEGFVKIWRWENGQLLNETNEYQDAVYSVSFSPDGKQLAAIDADGQLYLWQLDTNAVQILGRAHSGEGYKVAFNVLGTQLATAGNDGTVRIWTLTPERSVLTLVVPGGEVYDVAFQPGTPYLVTAGQDGIVRQYLLETDLLMNLAQNRGTRPFSVRECQQYLRLDSCP